MLTFVTMLFCSATNPGVCSGSRETTEDNVTQCWAMEEPMKEYFGMQGMLLVHYYCTYEED